MTTFTRAALALAITVVLPLAAGAQAPNDLVASWRELIELDLGHQVARDGSAALAADPELAQNGAAVALVARALFDSGAEEASRECLDGAQVTPRTAGWLELERARQLLELDELRAVIDLLKAQPPAASDPAQASENGAQAKLPVRFPELPLTWLYVGRALNRAGRSDDARPFLLKFAELAPLAPETPSAWHMLSIEAIGRRDMQAAREYQERGRELALWHTYYKTRRIQVRESPTDPLPHVGLAQLWLQLSENERALGEIEAALALDLKSAETWALSAETQRKLGRTADALAAYDRALELDPGQLLVRTNRALLHLTEGDAHKARTDLERVVADDDGSDARLAIAYLQLARLMRTAGDQAAAQELYATYKQRGGTEPL